MRLNNHRKNAKSQASILACKHFNEQNHNFQEHTEFTLTDFLQMKKQTTTEETRTILKRGGNFWVLKLKTLYPDGLNQELNNIC